jgi:hypothetical protein
MVWMQAAWIPKIDSRFGCRPPGFRESIHGLDAGHLDSENRFMVWMQATLIPKFNSRFGCEPPGFRKSFRGLAACHRAGKASPKIFLAA